MSVFEKFDLRAIGAQQPVDTDHLLADIRHGGLLLLNQRPKAYDWESHGVAEHILVIDGQVGIVTEHEGTLTASSGEMIVVPAGLRHAYHADSNGVVVVLFGGNLSIPETLTE